MRYVFGFLVVVMLACNNNPSAKQQSSNVTIADDKIIVGKQLFMNKCASCHAVKIDLAGPALAGVQDRWKDKQKLYQFIRHSQAMVATDAYAKALWLKWNKTEMTSFPDLTNEQIDLILQYVESNQ